MTTPTELPEALKPWHPWLAWFAPELVAETGLLMQRMQPLLGRFQGMVRGGQAEPDGLDDLRRRGPYERLLATEWLLADELPDEFLRRAASSEHLFLAPRPRARQTEKGIVAIFDAGPEQLGAPRLGQLALWILLARRAQLSGGALRWGVLQSPGALHDADDVRQLKALIKSRSFMAPEAAQAAAWQQALAELAQVPGETWLIGAAPAEQPVAERWTSHRVSLRRAVRGDLLEVSLSDRGALRQAQLELPSVQAAVPLLKGQFAIEATAPVDAHKHHRGRLSLQRPPVISARGLHVAVPLLDDAGVMIFPVPSAGQRKAGHSRFERWRARMSPLALMFKGKGLGALMSTGLDLHFWQVQSMGNHSMPGSDEFRAPPGLGVWLASAWLFNAKRQRVCVLDRDGRLMMWTHERNSSKPGAVAPTLADEGVRGMAQWSDESVSCAILRSGHLVLCELGIGDDNPVTVRAICQASAETVVLFSRAIPVRYGVSGCAVRHSPGDGGWETWHVHEPDILHLRHVGPAQWPSYALNVHHGVALVYDSSKTRFAMLGLSPDRTTLVLYSKEGSETIYTAPERIEKISVCPNTGLAAMLTVQRQLILYLVPRRSLRAMLHGEGQADATA